MKLTLTLMTSALALALQPQATAQLKTTAWQIHEGTEGTIAFKSDPPNNSAEIHNQAKIPPEDALAGRLRKSTKKVLLVSNGLQQSRHAKSWISPTFSLFLSHRAIRH